jgi:signal transduction histidine kinase
VSLARKVRLTARSRLAALFFLLFLGFGIGLQSLSYTLLDRQLPQQQQGLVSVAVPATSTPAVTEPSQGTTITSQATVSAALSHYRSDALHTLLKVSSLALVSMSAVAGVAVWLVARRVLRPLQQMNATARRIGEHNLDERLPVSGPADELRDLGETVNATFDRLASALAHERRLVANTSHELRTPVANQRALLEVTLGDPATSPERLREVCRTVLAQTHRHEALIAAMLALASTQHAELATSTVQLGELVQRVLDETAVGTLQVSVDLQDVVVEVDQLLCERALANLVTNAVRHNVEGGWVKVSVGTGREGAELVVTNSSPPLDPTVLERLREPFRRATADRTRSDGGVGLGLAIVQTIADRHGWTVSLRTPGPGVFEVSLGLAARVPGPVGA